MGSITLPTEAWAESQFGECDFGDVRRTRRAVRFAAQIANNSSGSTPSQTVAWNECKAAYRLINCEEVTFNAISRPHWRQTRARTVGHWLLLGDTTQCDFGVKRRVTGLMCSRKTLAKAARPAQPPGYQRATPRSKPAIEAYRSIIDARLLNQDESRPRKQRYYAARVAGRNWRRVVLVEWQHSGECLLVLIP
jgi:hypothetical protein